MTPRELIEKWEREADEAEKIEGEPIAPEDGQISEISRKHAAELRAALPEQPLSRKWRKEADELWEDAQDDLSSGSMVLEAYEMIADDPRGAAAEKLRKCADDLDAQHDQDRELLRRLTEAAENIRHHHCAYRDGSGMVVSKEHVKIAWEIADEARKHLGGESDG